MSTFPITTLPVDAKIPDADILYRAYLVPDPPQLQSLGLTAGLAEKVTYRILDGGETPVNVGRPIAYDLLPLYEESGVKPSPLISQKLKDFEFRLVKCACAFRSHDGTPHPFVWGQLKITLSSLAGGDAPIAFDVTPDEVTTQAEVSREVGLSPSLEFKDLKLGAGQVYMKAVKFTELRPTLTAFGKQDSVTGWEYAATPSMPDVRGNREGFVLVMSPRGADYRVAVDVQARVRENFLTKVFSRSRRWDDQDFVDLKSLDVPLTRAVPMTERELQSRFATGFADLALERAGAAKAENTVVIAAAR